MSEMPLSKCVLAAALLHLTVAARAQTTDTAAAAVQEWLKSQPSIQSVRLTPDDQAIVGVMVNEWKREAAAANTGLTIARDLDFFPPLYQEVIVKVVRSVFRATDPDHPLDGILTDVMRRNSQPAIIDSAWTPKGVTLVLHRMQMLLEYGAHSPDEAADRRLKHFKSFALPGYDPTGTQAVFLFSREFEPNTIRVLSAVRLKKSGRNWQVTARQDFIKSDFNISTK